MTAADLYRLLRRLASVDDVLRTGAGRHPLARFPARADIGAARREIEGQRQLILRTAGEVPQVVDLVSNVSAQLKWHLTLLTTASLRRVIKATGVVIHTNPGRARDERVILDVRTLEDSDISDVVAAPATAAREGGAAQ